MWDLGDVARLSPCGVLLQVADPHAPASSNGHIQDEESHENVEDLMSQLNALSAR